MAESLSIIYRDEDLIAINKPAGLLVHRTNIDRHENLFAMQLLRDQINQHVYPVHRLDKPTSGVLLFALHEEAARLMTELFTRSAVEKTYLAVVRGFVDKNLETIDHDLRSDPDRRRSGYHHFQSAITDYRGLETVELPYAVGRYPSSRYSLLEVKPKTGRQHQIRRHMKHIFHPIIGDTRYGEGRHNRFFREHFDCQRLLLCAVKLQFTHPYNHQQLTISADPEESFLQVISKLGLNTGYL